MQWCELKSHSHSNIKRSNMIQAIFEFRKSFECGTGIVISAYFDGLLSEIGGKSKAKECQNLKHVYSETSQSGVLIGTSHNRSIFCSYFGYEQSLKDFISKFLSDKSSGVVKLEDFVTQNSTYLEKRPNPFLLILVKEDDAIAISSCGVDTLEARRLDMGVYCIRDYTFRRTQQSDKNSIALIDSYLMSGEKQQQSTALIASKITNALKAEQEVGWSENATGCGLTLLKNDYESTIEVTDSKVFSPQKRPEPVKAKGLISGFNYYAMAQRVLIQDGQLDNNAVNSKIGANWKALSDTEKEPFMLRAKQEKEKHRAEQAVLDGQEPTSSSGGKAVTAYNLFVRQEKQFVFGLGVPDPQKRLGKHTGERWNAMSRDEKAVYEAIHEADASRDAKRRKTATAANNDGGSNSSSGGEKSD